MPVNSAYDEPESRDTNATTISGTIISTIIGSKKGLQCTKLDHKASDEFRIIISPHFFFPLPGAGSLVVPVS